MSAPWTERPTLSIDLGRALKSRYDQVPEEAIDAGRELIDTLLSELSGNREVWRLPAAVRLRTMNRFHAEATALSKLVGRDWKEIYLGNLAYDLTLAWMGCSTVVLPTPSGPVVARNMDWAPERVLARTSYLVKYGDRQGLRFASAGWPGAIGVVSGLSAKGFAIVLNAVQSDEGVNMQGYPVLMHLRRVLEDAKDFNDALTRLETQPLTLGALITLVGTKNEERVVIERTPTRAALRWGNGHEPLVATNDYRLLMPPETHEGSEIYETTCTRFEALSAQFDSHSSKDFVSDDRLLYSLTDDGVFSGITAQHVIMRPAENQIRLFIPTAYLSTP